MTPKDTAPATRPAIVDRCGERFPSETALPLYCDRGVGHDGNHSAWTGRGHANWPAAPAPAAEVVGPDVVALPSFRAAPAPAGETATAHTQVCPEYRHGIAPAPAEEPGDLGLLVDAYADARCGYSAGAITAKAEAARAAVLAWGERLKREVYEQERRIVAEGERRAAAESEVSRLRAERDAARAKDPRDADLASAPVATAAMIEAAAEERGRLKGIGEAVRAITPPERWDSDTIDTKVEFVPYLGESSWELLARARDRILALIPGAGAARSPGSGGAGGSDHAHDKENEP